MSIKLKRIRTVRIKFQSTFVLILGGVPIPVIPKYYVTEDGVSFGKRIVNFDCFICRRFCSGKKLGGRHLTANCKPAIGVSESDIGERVIPIGFSRLLEIGNGYFGFRLYCFENVKTPFHIKLIGLDIFGVMLFSLVTERY